MRVKRHNQLLQEDTSRWIVSYADFITLLFAFFVVMYALSSVNLHKYKSMAEGLNKVFTNKSKQTGVNKFDRPSQELGGVPLKGESFTEFKQTLQALESEHITVNQHQEWIELDIKASALFNSGDAKVNQRALAQIQKLADSVKNKPYPISLEGYTDNVPIQTPEFPSNWELSAARAAAIARLFVKNGVAANRLSATGFGSQHAIASNASETSRAKNRRVVIVIAKGNGIRRLLNPKLSRRVAQKKQESGYTVKEIKTRDGGVKFIRVKKHQGENEP